MNRRHFLHFSTASILMGSTCKNKRNYYVPFQEPKPKNFGNIPRNALDPLDISIFLPTEEDIGIPKTRIHHEIRNMNRQSHAFIYCHSKLNYINLSIDLNYSIKNAENQISKYSFRKYLKRDDSDIPNAMVLSDINEPKGSDTRSLEFKVQKDRLFLSLELGGLKNWATHERALDFLLNCIKRFDKAGLLATYPAFVNLVPYLPKQSDFPSERWIATESYHSVQGWEAYGGYIYESTISFKNIKSQGDMDISIVWHPKPHHLLGGYGLPGTSGIVPNIQPGSFSGERLGQACWHTKRELSALLGHCVVYTRIWGRDPVDINTDKPYIEAAVRATLERLENAKLATIAPAEVFRHEKVRHLNLADLLPKQKDIQMFSIESIENNIYPNDWQYPRDIYIPFRGISVDLKGNRRNDNAKLIIKITLDEIFATGLQGIPLKGIHTQHADSRSAHLVWGCLNVFVTLTSADPQKNPEESDCFLVKQLAQECLERAQGRHDMKAFLT